MRRRAGQWTRLISSEAASSLHLAYSLSSEGVVRGTERCLHLYGPNRRVVALMGSSQING